MVAAKNATKHGILSRKPPLLITEDRDQYDAMVSGLVETYCPQGPLEEMLIRQIAMGFLRQERLWSVEAAIANIEIIRQQKAIRYPDKQLPSALGLLENLEKMVDNPPIPRKDVLQKELMVISPYKNKMRSRLSLEDNAAQAEELLTDCTDLRNEAKHLHTEDFPWWDSIQNIADNSCKQIENDFDLFHQVVTDFAKQIFERVTEIQGAIATIEQLEQASDEAKITQASIQNPNLFARYQTAISRDLHLAIARLFEIQERRIGTSITSFGQN